MNQKPTFPKKQSDCQHKFWLCNDVTIELAYPAYFDTHPRTEPENVLELCVDCGFTQTLVLYVPMRFGIKKVA